MCLLDNQKCPSTLCRWAFLMGAFELVSFQTRMYILCVEDIVTDCLELIHTFL